MSLRLVNGYVCRNCTDEDLAKKGIDPEHPKRGVAGNDKTQKGEAKRTIDGTNAVDPKQAPGSVEQTSNAVALGENRPEASGDLGRRLNVFA